MVVNVVRLGEHHCIIPKTPNEMLWLVLQRDGELTPAVVTGDSTYRKRVRSINSERSEFLDWRPDKHELNFRAENWSASSVLPNK